MIKLSADKNSMYIVHVSSLNLFYMCTTCPRYALIYQTRPSANNTKASPLLETTAVEQLYIRVHCSTISFSAKNLLLLETTDVPVRTELDILVNSWTAMAVLKAYILRVFP